MLPRPKKQKSKQHEHEPTRHQHMFLVENVRVKWSIETTMFGKTFISQNFFTWNILLLISLFMIMASNMGPSLITNSTIRLMRHSWMRSGIVSLY